MIGMAWKETLESRWIALLAIIGPLIAMLSIAVSIALSPWFSFEGNALSDLGVRPVAPIFNSGLIICGILCAIFCLHLYLRIGMNWPIKIGISLILAACIALIGIGVFTEHSMSLHIFFSVAFFVLLLLAALITGACLLIVPKMRVIGILAFSVAIIGTVGWAISDRWSGVAIPELLSVVPACVWFVYFGLWMYKKNGQN